MATNTQAIQGEWKQLCALARQRWSQLTDDDLPALEGTLEQLVVRIQQKTGEGRDTIERFFSDVSSRGSSAVAHASEAAGQYAHQVGDRFTSATTVRKVWSAPTRRRR